MITTSIEVADNIRNRRRKQLKIYGLKTIRVYEEKSISLREVFDKR